MADEKKPKIDLKARLGKTVAPATAPVATPPPAAPAVSPSGRPMPMPPASRPPEALPPPSVAPGAPSSQAPGLRTPTPLAGVPLSPVAGLGGLPIPPGVAGGNPVASPYAQSAYQQPARAMPPEPQRIEVDDLTVQQASRGGIRKGIIIGCVVAVILGGVGYVAGSASEQSAGRAKAKEGAVDLANNAGKAKEQLKTLADKMEAGRKSLIQDHKFPADLAGQLGAINVDFDGKQLEGRRFSGFSTDTTRDLVEFITAVQGVNDKKLLIQGLLTRLQKPIEEQLKIPEGQTRINYVVAIDHDPNGNVAGFLSHLADPIPMNGSSFTLPTEFKFTSPGGSGNTSLPAFKSGDIAQKPAAIYVVPKSFDTACPSATGGQIAQLGAQIASFISELKGETPDPNIVTDTKQGLIDRADKLIKELGTVGS